jgi:hypothetical protein
MKLNKSPGLDGLSVEFYRTFWDKLKYFLIKTYYKSYEENMSTYSQRSSVLVLVSNNEMYTMIFYISDKNLEILLKIIFQ